MVYSLFFRVMGAETILQRLGGKLILHHRIKSFYRSFSDLTEELPTIILE